MQGRKARGGKAYYINVGADVNACEITAAVTALANAIACRMDDEELALLGAVLTQLGDTLETISAGRAMQAKCCGDVGK